MSILLRMQESRYLIYKSTRKPTAFKRWVFLNEVRGLNPVPRKARSATFIWASSKADCEYPWLRMQDQVKNRYLGNSSARQKRLYKLHVTASRLSVICTIISIGQTPDMNTHWTLGEVFTSLVRKRTEWSVQPKRIFLVMLYILALYEWFWLNCYIFGYGWNHRFCK